MTKVTTAVEDPAMLVAWTIPDGVLKPAEIGWIVLTMFVFGLAIYRVKLGGLHFRVFPRPTTPTDSRLHRVDVLGSSLTLAAMVYGVLLAWWIASSIADKAIRTFVRLLAY